MCSPNILDLPSFLATYMLSACSCADLANLAKSCKAARDMCYDPELWSEVAVEYDERHGASLLMHPACVAMRSLHLKKPRSM